jgi:DNA polymerase elongation subunit (family B)
MSSSENRRTFNQGYRSWFKSFHYKQQKTIPIFILDFETSSRRDEEDEPDFDEDNYSEMGKSRKIINGIQIYFLDEEKIKRTSFLRHDPYFYLLLESDLNKNQVNRIITQIQELGERKVKHVSAQICHDAADLTFLAEKEFIKVTVDHPGSVPNLRTKCESIPGVIEWREADVLYNHRVAIDHNVRVGRWYEAEISRGEIQKITMLTNKAPPELMILAYDIETVFDITREPDPNRDAISMVSLFMGDTNFLLINDQVVETKDVSQLEIVLKKKDEDHNKPWVDWCKSGTIFPPSLIIDRIPVILEVFSLEIGLLRRFYEILEEFKPEVIADFFGDRFDIPFLAIRSSKYGISFEERTGFKIKFKQQGPKGNRPVLAENYSPASIDAVSGAGVIHLDAYLFNEKYSYLPKKDLGLKPSVEKKLKIIPIGREALFEIEENPEDAVGYAACDGYITHRYVKEIVLDFFISMGQMFPVPASELLTRRAGSLDDLLIDAEDRKFNIVGKRRVEQNFVESFSPEITIDSLAYTGGLVEARRSGIFRSDIFTEYPIDALALDNIKEIVRQIIIKYSNNTAKKEIKNEFDRKMLAEFGDLSFDYSEDIEQLISNFNDVMLNKGIKSSDLEEKHAKFRQILENIAQIYVKDVDKVVENTLRQINLLSLTKGPVQLRGIHVDVTSMYPSQIRQYKLQPSGIVPLSKCIECKYTEEDGSCYFEGDWVIKLTGRRPCRFRSEGSRVCESDNCTPKNESSCKNYEPESSTTGRVQEIFTYDGKNVQAYVVKKKAGLVKISLTKSYLSKISNDDVYSKVKSWLETAVEATQITCNLDKNHFDTFEDQPDGFKLPENTFLSLDVRTKKISVLISVKSRVCQKAFNFVARIMDDFFNTRVKHKFEAQRLYQIIKQKNKLNQPVPPDMLRQQKFHDSTQLGMKVPLNSIYGLLGMKAGVRNASAPCAGITTKLSADLIHWAADQLEKIGMVTELDTDGVWMWVPRQFPLEFSVNLINPSESDHVIEFKESLIDKILNEQVKAAGFNNDDYWYNDGAKIDRISKSLIQFEQDGPYDFQFVMGKKKYIVYNYDIESKQWDEKEITGMESKRADFSKLQKLFQEEVIKGYLENYNVENPISLFEIYQNATKNSTEIRKQVEEGKLDHSYFIKPKALNKPLNEYHSKLPQVTAARILQDLGFTVDPGIRIQMISIIGNHVIPSQVFDLDFEKVKSVFNKYGICTLSFMLNEITSIEDIRKLIDIKQYLSDIFDPGRIFDRMIKYPMQTQKLMSESRKTLVISDLKEVEGNQFTKRSIDTTKIVDTNKKPQPIIAPIPVKIVKHEITERKRQKSSKRKGKQKTQSLDSIFNFPAVKKSSKTPKVKKPVKKATKGRKSDSKTSFIIEKDKMDVKPIKIESTIKKSELISADEIDELQTDNLFTNGHKHKESLTHQTNTESDDENIVCNHCGAIISSSEVLNEGCIHCTDQFEVD